MKKTIFTMTALAFASTSAFAQWQLVDDFDDEDNTGDWMVRYGTEEFGDLKSNLEIQDDPAGDDKCLVVAIGTSQTNGFTLDLGAQGLSLETTGFDTSLRTMYYEWLIPSVETETGTIVGFQNATSGMMSSNFYFGDEFEADGVTPRIQPDPIGLDSGPGWGGYAGYLRSNSGKFDTRDDGFTDPVPDIQEVGDEWYKFWVVYDIPGKKYQMWCQGGTFTEPTLVTTEHVVTATDGTETVKFPGDWARFRADSSDPLDWFTIITNVNISVTDGSRGNHNSYMDNLYVDRTGMNLTDPTGGDSLPSSGELINIATRGLVGEGNDVMIAGFVVEGGPKKVLVQAVGTELIAGGLDAEKVLADPVLTIVPAVTAGDASTHISNDDWSGSDIVEAATSVGATALDTGSTSSAIIATLPAGAYTTIVSGGDGIALVEAYDID